MPVCIATLQAYLFPRRNLRVVVDARNVGHATGGGSDLGSFCDEERARAATALRVVFLHDREGKVVWRAAHPCHRCESDAVLQRDGADLQRLEKLGDGHDSREARSVYVGVERVEEKAWSSSYFPYGSFIGVYRWVLQPACLAAYQTKAAEKDDTSELRRVFPEMSGAGMLAIRLRNMEEGVSGPTSGIRKHTTENQ